MKKLLMIGVAVAMMTTTAHASNCIDTYVGAVEHTGIYRDLLSRGAPESVTTPVQRFASDNIAKFKAMDCKDDMTFLQWFKDYGLKWTGNRMINMN